MARDWTRAFRPASFKGASFRVEVEEFAGGRRVAVQNVAYGESPITEDFGQSPRATPVFAYCIGDAADVMAEGLKAALSSPGPGLLILPMQAPRMAHATDFRMSRVKERGGVVRFDIQFLDAGASAGFASAFGASAAISAFDRLTAAVSGSF